jgi:trans-aconitate methyltransferase
MNLNFFLRDPIRHYHQQMIQLHGADSSLALGWRTRDDQLLRFRILAEIADLNERSVLDAGCGYGDLYTFLLQIYPTVKYSGIEQMTEMVKEGRRSVPGIMQGDFLRDRLPVSDYVLVSGSLNYGQDVFEAIPKLYAACTMGLGFNLLRKVTGEGILKAHDPDEIFAFARTLSPNVALRDDYAEEDFTLFIYR